MSFYNMKPLGWRANEVIGTSYVNPIIYVFDALNTNKSKDSITENNIGELIKLCFSYMPHRKEKVLELVTQYFPQYSDKINSYKILL